MKPRCRAGFCCLVVSVVVAALSAQDAPAVRSFRLADRGAFRLLLPTKWKASADSSKEVPSVYIKLDPRNRDVSVQITAAALDSNQMTRMSEDSLRRTVETSGKALLSQSVETSVSVQELRGSNSTGFYYALTDRAPSRTGYKYLIQGSQLTGRLLVTFTILHRAPSMPEVSEALDVLRTASFEP